MIPGGVNSPVRAYAAVGGSPPFIARGKGAHVWDADGRRYVDYVGSWGPLILGHAHPAVLRAVARAAARGTSFGAPTAGEVEIAEKICAALPSVEMVRFVSSGTEATMSAIRLARARDRPQEDPQVRRLLSRPRRRAAGRRGLGRGDARHPRLARRARGVRAAHRAGAVQRRRGASRPPSATHGPELACVIVEPVAGNMGCVPPVRGFLEELRELCDRHGALLIFDEVMTGFRVAWGGAQALYEIRPDLTCLGKVVGGGLPAAAYGGRRELMREIAPSGPVYQAGTLSGNPLAVAAGLETLRPARAAAGSTRRWPRRPGC